MSDLLKPPAASTTVAQLKDYSEYEHWAQFFQIACQYKGIWNLFTGDEQILPEPDAGKYEQEVWLAHSDSVVYYLQHRQDRDYEQWEKQGLRIQHAMAFLAESLDSEIRRDIQACKPNKAWTLLSTAYEADKLKNSERKRQHRSRRNSPYSKWTTSTSAIAHPWTTT